MRDPETELAVEAPTRKNTLRAVALGSAAVFLLASSYQASFALSRIGKPISHIDQYNGGGGDDDDDDDGLSGGAIAGIAIGVAAVGAGIYYLANKDKDEEEDGSTEKMGQAKPLPALPEGVREFSGVRLSPGASELVAGGTRIFDLQVQSKVDGKWYSVTGRAETQIALKGSQPAVVPVDGVKNTFCVPISAPRSANGKSVTVVGTFSPKGQAPLTAEAQLQIRVQPAGAAVATNAF